MAWLAQPKLRSSEGWRPGLELNQEKGRCTAPALAIPPPGRSNHCSSDRGGPSRHQVNPTRRSMARERLAGHEGHAPGIMADILMSAGCAEPGRGKLRRDLLFTVALQADLAAQLPVVR